MGVLGFYVLIPVAPCKMVEWFNATELCHIFQAVWEPEACLCKSEKKIGEKMKFLKLTLASASAVPNPFIFHDLIGKMKTAADISGPFLLQTHFWFPLKIKTCPLTYFSGYLFWPALTFCPLQDWTLGGTRLQWAPLERGEPQLSNGVQNIKIGRRLPTQIVARRQKSHFLKTWPFSEKWPFLA